MLISGALAGFLGFNEIMGNHRQIVLDFVAGAGFTGIAVALMGRNHPIGIILASLLFGALFQGGSEVAFDIPTINRDMIVVMQGLVILFSGALAYVNRPIVEKLWRLYQARRGAKAPAVVVAPVSPATAPDAPVARAEETATVAAMPAAPAPVTLEAKPAQQAEPLEVVEAEIVTMGPDAASTKAPDKLPWLKASQRKAAEAEIVTTGPVGLSDPEPAPEAPRKKRGPKKSKRKPGEV
jgi:simple sugar transport system permease protein